MRGIKSVLLVAAIALILIAPVSAFETSCSVCHNHINITKNFSASLHYTVAGIRIGFAQGAGKALGMSKFPTACASCHIGSCTKCHEYHGEIPNMSTCVECHEHNIGVNYEGYLIEKSGKGPHPDIHYLYGLNCTDCHGKWEIHGDGHTYTSAFYAVKVSCASCHEHPGKTVKVRGKVIKVKQYNPNLLVHRLHANDVSCVACHATWYQTCVNCHLETFKPDKVVTNDFHLVIGPDGKLYPATIMEVSYHGKTSTSLAFITPHTISAKGRPCKDCHGKNQYEVFHPKFQTLVGPPGVRVVPPNYNITNVSFDKLKNATFITPDMKLAQPPSMIVIDLHSFGIPLKINITQLGTLIISAVICGLIIHLLKRRITLGRWIG